MIVQLATRRSSSNWAFTYIAMQSQKAVFAYFTSEQILPLGFAGQYTPVYLGEIRGGDHHDITSPLFSISTNLKIVLTIVFHGDWH